MLYLAVIQQLALLAMVRAGASKRGITIPSLIIAFRELSTPGIELTEKLIGEVEAYVHHSK